MRPHLRQYRGGAEIGRRRLGQCRAVHDLPRALAGHPELHEVPAARIPEDVRKRRLSAEYAADDRPARARAGADRGAGGRGVMTIERPQSRYNHRTRAPVNSGEIALPRIATM